MRIRWRGFEMPTRVEKEESTSSATYAKFFAEPFERGFATTIANSLRRVLLSSIQGAAVRSCALKVLTTNMLLSLACSKTWLRSF